MNASISDHEIKSTFGKGSNTLQDLMEFHWNLWMKPWASAHRGKWGQLNLPWKNGWKIKKWKHAKREVFYVYVKFWEQSGQAGVENGTMLPHIYSDILPNAPICSEIFTIFFASGGNRHWPPNQNPVDALGWSRSYFYVHVSKMLWNNAWSAGYLHYRMEAGKSSCNTKDWQRWSLRMQLVQNSFNYVMPWKTFWTHYFTETDLHT